MVRRKGRRREYITAGLCFFGRADERSAKFHCKGMHFKGELKTNKVLSALTTKSDRGSRRKVVYTYYHNILRFFN